MHTDPFLTYLKRHHKLHLIYTPNPFLLLFRIPGLTLPTLDMLKGKLRRALLHVLHRWNRCRNDVSFNYFGGKVTSDNAGNSDKASYEYLGTGTSEYVYLYMGKDNPVSRGTIWVTSPCYLFSFPSLAIIFLYLLIFSFHSLSFSPSVLSLRQYRGYKVHEKVIPAVRCIVERTGITK